MTEALATRFAGRRGRLFGMAFSASVLTVLTLGIYRFWMKTRLRRWYWSSIRPGGDPLEYTGQPLEKLLGFLIAVVFLAFYLGLVNLALVYGSLVLFEAPGAAYALSLIGLVPLIFFARYRAWRYLLARTRWRGLRFGLAPGAWGYAWRAVLFGLLTIGTLGLLWPLMVFRLEKYRTDRTWFGDQRLSQGGRWYMLYPAASHLMLSTIATLVTSVVAAEIAPEAAFALIVTIPWMLYGIAHWQARKFQRLTEAKQAGGIRFEARPRPWRLVRIYVLGFLIMGVVLGLISVALVASLGLTFAPILEGLDIPELTQFEASLPDWVPMVAAVFSYVAFFLFWSVLTHVFLTFPIWRHFAETFRVVEPGEIDWIHQRSRDEAEDAGGMAEALDVGAAI